MSEHNGAATHTAEQTANIAAERSALSAAIQDPFGADKVCELLEQSDFVHPMHRTVFGAIAALNLTRAPIDAVAIGGLVAKSGVRLSEVLDIQAAEVSAARAAAHSGIVLRAAQIRALSKLATDLAQATQQAAPTPEGLEALLELVRRRMDGITSRVPGRQPILLADAEPGMIERIMSDAPTPMGTPTGFPDIDYASGGLRDGEMIVLAARPSVGKSLLAANIAENVTIGDDRRAVLFLSLEMSGAQLYRRFLFARAGVPSELALRGIADELQKADLVEAHGALKRARWYVHAEAGITAQRAYALARRFKNKHGDCLIIVDYLQLMSGPGGNRTEVVTNLSAAMKNLAVELHCPVLVLAQLNRGGADIRKKGTGETVVTIPALNDLRDSGAIEQDADVVLFLARDIMQQAPHVAHFIVAKNRPARIGKCQLLFDTNGPRFKSVERVQLFDGRL